MASAPRAERGIPRREFRRGIAQQIFGIHRRFCRWEPKGTKIGKQAENQSGEAMGNFARAGGLRGTRQALKGQPHFSEQDFRGTPWDCEGSAANQFFLLKSPRTTLEQPTESPEASHSSI